VDTAPLTGHLMDRIEAFTEAIVEMDEELALALVRELTDAGASRSAILQAATAALQTVGERYERQEYFLSALIVGGDIFKQVVEALGPETRRNPKDVALGRVLLGTVEGDLHDIGKNMASTALSALGFDVRDIGVDVPSSHFVEHVREYHPHILGLSGILIPIAATAMRKTVEAVKADGDETGEMPFVVIGGRVDQAIAEYVRSDSWTTDAMEGARICQRFMEAKKS
jgi:methanogenic corrinoid protein MtbC1